MNQRKVQLPGEAGCLGKLELTCFPGGTSGKEPTCQCKRHETWVWSLGQEDPLEKEMATHSSILAQESCEKGAWQAIFHGVVESDMTDAT